MFRGPASRLSFGDGEASAAPGELRASHCEQEAHGRAPVRPSDRPIALDRMRLVIGLSDDGCGCLTVEVSGGLTSSDYDRLVVRLEHQMHPRGRLQLLILLEDFEGWTPAAMPSSGRAIWRRSPRD
jgi:hypothetical protein